jgi:hypothetical protein
LQWVAGSALQGLFVRHFHAGFGTMRILAKTFEVIPAKAIIHSFQIVDKGRIPLFKGMTTFCSDVLIPVQPKTWIPAFAGMTR